MNRVVNVIRMQLINRETFIWVPLIVLAGAFLLSLAIFAMIPTDAPKYGGASQAPLWYLSVVGAMALTRTFPFSQAMSVTRREFYVGTLLTAVGAAFVLAVVFVLGGLVERATGGWGMNGYFFSLDWVWASGPVVAGLLYFALGLLFFVAGFWGATIFKRFGPLVLTIVLVAIAAVLVAAMWLTGQLNAWGQVIGWFGTLGAGGTALLTGAIAALLALVSFPILRRAVA